MHTRSCRTRPARRPLASRVARWHPPTAAAVVVLIGLFIHEVAYWLADGSDYPLTVVGNQTRVFVMSHGGLDAFAVGALVIATLFLIEAAHSALERRNP